jgi:hypothetical protein
MPSITRISLGLTSAGIRVYKIVPSVKSKHTKSRIAAIYHIDLYRMKE